MYASFGDIESLMNANSVDAGALPPGIIAKVVAKSVLSLDAGPRQDDISVLPITGFRGASLS